jgi:hypothetical protein
MIDTKIKDINFLINDFLLLKPKAHSVINAAEQIKNNISPTTDKYGKKIARENSEAKIDAKTCLNGFM